MSKAEVRTLFPNEPYSGAAISADGLYRYKLWRTWGDGPTVNFIMLNPSKADAEVDDATIRRCLRFSRDWGYGGLVVTNLFAWRSTDPKGLLTTPDPIGPENDRHIGTEALGAERVVCAWGEPPKRLAWRAEEVFSVLRGQGLSLYCLTRTVSGQPGHPLRLAAELVPRPVASLSLGSPTP